jgi:DNA replication initiation complex subunit (GINS family)
LATEYKKYLEAVKNFDSAEAKKFSNLRTMVLEIFKIREKKILNQVLLAESTGEESTEGMISFESEVFKKVLASLKESQHKINSLFKNGEESKEDKVHLEILKNIPAFVGPDETEYGPYEATEKVSLPKDIAEILVARDLAQRI